MKKGESPFRDGRDGALARRGDLLRTRRDEFAEMPEEIRRVFVARWARIGGALAASIVGCAGLVVALPQRLAPETGNAVLRFAELLLPASFGNRPAVLATLAVGAWLAGAFAYLLGKALAERAFARHMSQSVRPTDDLYHDVERLSHVSPVSVAQTLALRVEGWSVALPIVALSLLLPSACVYLGQALQVGGYPTVGDFDDGLLRCAELCAWLALAGALSGGALRFGLRRWTTARLGLATRGVAAAGVALAVVLAVGFGLPLAGSLLGLTLMAVWALRRIRRERVLLGLADSNVAALDGPVSRVVTRIFVVPVVAAVTWPVWTIAARRVARMVATLIARRRRTALALAGFAAGAATFAYLAARPDGPPAPVKSESRPAAPAPQLAPLPGTQPTTTLTHDPTAGAIISEIPVGDGTPGVVDLQLPKLADAMSGWKLNVRVQLVAIDDQPPGERTIQLAPSRELAMQPGSRWEFTTDCEPAPAIQWRAAADAAAADAARRARLAWNVSISSCTLVD